MNSGGNQSVSHRYVPRNLSAGFSATETHSSIYHPPLSRFFHGENTMDTTLNPNRPWGWVLTFGIILIILGLIAISVAAITTIISVILVGVLLLIAGVATLIDAFQTWNKRVGYLILHVIMGLLYVAAAIALLRDPLIGAVTMTLLLAIFYVILGIFRIITSLTFRVTSYWGWRLFSGIVTLILGIFILSQWPAYSLFVIGLIVGIELLFNGFTYLLLAIGSRASQKSVPR